MLRMKLCGVVITYYPMVKEAKENILRYLPFVDHLIIWENTPREDAEQFRITLPKESQSKITYLSSGKNEGIAYPLNQAMPHLI